jgi:hypothetical protein
VNFLEESTELDIGCRFYKLIQLKKRRMSQNLPRCERLLSEIEFETETGNEECIGDYTAVGVERKRISP